MTHSEFDEYLERKAKMVESADQLAEMLDSLKTNLEAKGWAGPEAVQASIAMSNTMLMLSAQHGMFR